MKTVKKNVYYCDFCKKKGLSSYHMKEHEGRCTGNINRHCRMCEHNEPDYAALAEKYKAQMKSRPTEDSIDGIVWDATTVEQKPNLADIFDDCEGCPACVLTILRACGLCGYPWDMGFSWKKERDEYMAERNANNTPDYGDIQ